MDSLPLELITLIISHIDLSTLFNLTLVNKLFHIETKRILGPKVSNNVMMEFKEWFDKQGNRRFIQYGINKNKIKEKWFDQHNRCHRLNGPAYIIWYDNGYKCDYWVNKGVSVPSRIEQTIDEIKEIKEMKLNKQPKIKQI